MEGEIQIIDFAKNSKLVISHIIKKWYLVLLLSFFCGCICVIFTWIQDSEYTAEISFVSENEKSSSLGGYASIAAQFGFDLGSRGGSAFEGDNLIGFLKSKKLIDKTLLTKDRSNNLLLIEQYIQNHKLNNKLTKEGVFGKILFDTTSEKNTRQEDSIINFISERILKKQLTIDKVDKKQDIVSIKFSDNNEYFSKLFVEELTNNAIKFYTDYKSKKSSDNVNILAKQVDSIRSILFGGITDVATLNDLNLNPLKQTSKTGYQKRQIDIQVNSLLYGELVKNLELAKLALRKETPLIQIIDTPILPLKNAKMGRLAAGLIGAILAGFASVLFLIIQIVLKLKFISYTKPPILSHS